MDVGTGTIAVPPDWIYPLPAGVDPFAAAPGAWGYAVAKTKRPGSDSSVGPPHNRRTLRRRLTALFVIVGILAQIAWLMAWQALDAPYEGPLPSTPPRMSLVISSSARSARRCCSAQFCGTSQKESNGPGRPTGITKSSRIASDEPGWSAVRRMIIVKGWGRTPSRCGENRPSSALLLLQPFWKRGLPTKAARRRRATWHRLRRQVRRPRHAITIEVPSRTNPRASSGHTIVILSDSVEMHCGPCSDAINESLELTLLNADPHEVPALDTSTRPRASAATTSAMPTPATALATSSAHRCSQPW
jgi:hypothetical protein